MKLTLIRKDKKHQTHVNHNAIEWLMTLIIGFPKVIHHSVIPSISMQLAHYERITCFYDRMIDKFANEMILLNQFRLRKQ